MRNAIPKSIDRHKLLQETSLRIYQAIYRVDVGRALTNYDRAVAEDPSSLTVHEVLGKISDFVDSEPVDENYIVFLHYLAKYPVSMCKRHVSPLLRFLIGFHYKLGQMFKEDYKKVKPVSMEELAEIFGRSKATIHKCIEETEAEWKNFLADWKRQEKIETKAERELVEEAKGRLRREGADPEARSVQNENTNERALLLRRRCIIHSYCYCRSLLSLKYHSFYNRGVL
ncbi:hypothetical protein GTO27_01210 [Candidatus Bathyarchaeota archaeon]|nr:hypothetical protein [Candidatus Bathyarchaeota archaeon]